MFLDKHFIEFFENKKEKKLDIAVATVIETKGSTFSKVGNMMLIDSNGESIGVLGSKYLHEKVFQEAKKALIDGESYTFESIPKDESSGHGTSKYEIKPYFFDKNYSNLEELLNIDLVYSLLIFGSDSHVTPLVLMANLMGWRTTVIDVEIKKEFVGQADVLIELEKLEDVFTMDLSSYNGSVILSHSPKTDDKYLQALLNTNMNYIGMMGNRKNMQKKAEIFNLIDDDRFFAPVGLKIGGNTAQSIALSICAQIEAKKNGKI
ncbi:XdhC family protein [Halarcobacter ebronensis]|uniref:XdhC Rossmann domain-containing protein n=1 Tax=Halarcobacter ebronensis TaxID=1462615 RepID=A0A4Q1AN16_9BACT|nr:XdhC/CoxI family protein [Halarcobacter ebronensis]QKF82476.1 dehydrogenase maturation factor (XdhC/CoxI/CoxF family) [Halarcobacter ebronensis]RXK07504.1 hypothetical protein CRV07_03315 [Halarcobacter ebronensis]